MSEEAINRRKFLEFMGRGVVAAQALTSFSLLSSTRSSWGALSNTPPFQPLAPTAKDDLVLAEGFQASIIAKWGDNITAKETFGFNNDFLAFVPLEGKKDDGILWVNHEYPNPRFVSGFEMGGTRTKTQVDKERYSVGGSLVRIKKSRGKWQVVKNDRYNRRITGATKMEMSQKVAGKRTAEGTLGNCAGGVTPWGTILSAEENYQYYYGEVDSKGKWKAKKRGYGWENYYKNSPQHYGWIVEVSPLTGKARKLVSLGRFCHEGATVTTTKDGRPVVYSGDDAADQCIYKFIGDKPRSLEKGTLYVADTKMGKWIALDYKTQPILQKNFKDQTDVLVNARKAAKLLGGTPLERPEGIAIDPINKGVYVALTNDVKRGNYFGMLLKIQEKNDKPESLQFKASSFLAGGPKTGFAAPDNIIFDKKGNLWMTSDISGSATNKPPYTVFKNNGLYYIPTSGAHAGKVFQVASAPVEAELTGPWFAPDGETLFLSVQHPGEKSKPGKLTSHWPNGGNADPKPGVVAISGPAMRKLLA